MARLDKTIQPLNHTFPRVLIAVIWSGRASLNKTRTFGRTHWINISHELHMMRPFFRPGPNHSTEDSTINRLKSEIQGLLQDCKAQAQVTKASRPARCNSRLPFSLSPLNQGFACQVSQLYLSMFESSFRILHVPTYLMELDRCWSDPESVSAAMQHRIQLVVAIGFSLHADFVADKGLRAAATQWLYEALDWVAGPLEKDRLSIHGLQVQCLLILARQTLSVGGDLIWLSMGTVTHSAMQMGLHRDPKHFPHMSLLQAEIRRRLWATILELNLQSSLDSGMPPVSYDWDTEPPLDINDHQITEKTTTLPRKSAAEVTDTSVQLILLKALPARQNMVKCMNGIHAELLYDEVLRLSKQINESCLATQKLLRAGEAATPADIFRFNLAQLLLRRFSLTLHRSFATHARTNPLFLGSMKTYLGSATAILSPEPEEHFSRLLAVGGGLFKSSIFQAALAVGSELVMQVKDEEITDTSTARRQPRPEIESLKDAVKTGIRHATERIRHGETNVKLHLVLSMALGYADAVEAGRPVELAMGNSAKQSLQDCHDLLLGRGQSSSKSGNAQTDIEIATYSAWEPEATLDDSWFVDFLDDVDCPFMPELLSATPVC